LIPASSLPRLSTVASPLPARRRRGGQPGNLNARAHGLHSLLAPSPHSAFLSNLHELQDEAQFPTLPLDRILASAVEQRDRLEVRLAHADDDREFLALLEISFKTSAVIDRILRQIAAATRPYADLLRQALSPLELIQSSFHHRGITRDADSFFSTFEKSTLNSLDFPVSGPPSSIFREASQKDGSLSHSFSPTFEKSTLNLVGPSSALGPPSLLTSSQWSILAPLIPPDPQLDHMHGEPPALIAASRWRFTVEVPGPLASFEALEEYRRLTPASVLHEQPAAARRSERGRPSASPRALLDGIFWKLANARGWGDLPPDFPSWRTCQEYYRRLFNSGRLYTLLLALYDHLRMCSGTDPALLVEQGQLTLDPRGKVVPAAAGPLDWQVHTSLLFLQLAHASAARRSRTAPPGPCYERDLIY
jgi:transposase